MILYKEDIVRLSEAAAKAGISLAEAAAALAEAFGHIGAAVAVFISVADIIVKHRLPPDETLRELAIGREGHLMNNAKKYRTRKKYRNRLIKRYYNKKQTEEHTNENDTTNY